MDTITHGIVGALAGKAFFAGHELPIGTGRENQSREESASAARTAIAACTLGAIFPDIDVIAGPLAQNPLAIMEWHRNITHSLVLLPVWALLLALATIPVVRWLQWERPSFAKLVAIYAFGLATHVFLDVVTNFGTIVWSPLRYTRVAWDWLFIIDLILTGIALVPQLAAWCYCDPAKFAWRAGAVWVALSLGALGSYALAGIVGYGFPIWVAGVASAVMAAIIFAPKIGDAGFGWKRTGWCRVGTAAVCAYLALAAAAHHQALADVKVFATSHQLQEDNIAALPLPPTLTRWAGVVSTPEGVWRATFRIPDGGIEHMQLYGDVGSDRYVQQAKELRGVQVYLWFARFPVWRVSQRDGQTVVDVTDIRFFRGEDSSAGVESNSLRSSTGIRGNAAGFTFEVVFDAQGRVTSSGFKKPQS